MCELGLHCAVGGRNASEIEFQFRIVEMYFCFAHNKFNLCFVSIHRFSPIGPFSNFWFGGRKMRQQHIR